MPRLRCELTPSDWRVIVTSSGHMILGRFSAFSLSLSLAVVGLAQQEVTQRPRVGFASGGGAKHTKAVADQTKGTVTCKDPGEDCKIVDRLLLSPTRPIPDHDASLQDITRQVNGIVAELRARNQDPKRQLAVVLTPYAPFLVWCRPDEAITKPLSLGENPRLFYEIFGIAASVAKMQAASGGTTRNWTFTGPGGYVCYPSKYAKQLTATFVEAAKTTAAHDELLQSATRRINALLQQAGALRGPAGKELSLMVTPMGLLLAWSRNEGSGYRPPREAITFDSPLEILTRELALPLR